MKQYLMAAAAAGLALTLTADGAGAADVTLLCSNALKSVLEELGPQFEKASGHKLKIEYGSTGPLKAQIEKGQAFDVAILGVEATDGLLKSGKLASGSRVDIARSGMGVAIRGTRYLLVGATRRSTRDNFEGEAKDGQILTRMIVDCGQLRQTIVVRPTFGAFVDGGVEIDEMQTWGAGCLHNDLNIALAIEGACVT